MQNHEMVNTPIAPELAQMMDTVAQAAANKSTLYIQGNGSKAHLAGFQPSAHAVLDTRSYSGIVSHLPSELYITVKAGTPVREVDAALAQHGQYLAFEPPFAHNATVGGVVASALSGPARANNGAVRDYILGVQIINGQGQLLQFGGQVMKNVAGYDVSRLMSGSWGGLALITEVTLKVMPVPPAEATLRFQMPQPQALQLLRNSSALPLPLNASCWLPDAGGTLWLRLRGAKAAVQSALASFSQQHHGTEVEAATAAAFWQSVRDQQLPMWQQRAADQAVWRLSVPPNTPAMPLDLPHCVEWHGGLRWVIAPAQGPIAEQLLQWAQAVGGHARLHLAPTSQPDAFAQTALQPVLRTIHQRLKASIDPASVFASAHPVF